MVFYRNSWSLTPPLWVFPKEKIQSVRATWDCTEVGLPSYSHRLNTSAASSTRVEAMQMAPYHFHLSIVNRVHHFWDPHPDESITEPHLHDDVAGTLVMKGIAQE